MTRMNVGLQLYTVRDATAQDFEVRFAKLLQWAMRV